MRSCSGWTTTSVLMTPAWWCGRALPRAAPAMPALGSCTLILSQRWRAHAPFCVFFHVTASALPSVRHVRVARPALTARRAAGDHGAGAAQRAAPLAPGHLPACAAAARAHGGRGPRGPSTR